MDIPRFLIKIKHSDKEIHETTVDRNHAAGPGRAVRSASMCNRMHSAWSQLRSWRSLRAAWKYEPLLFDLTFFFLRSAVLGVFRSLIQGP